MPSLDDIAKLKTVEGCEQYALNNESRSPELAQAARRRAVELQAATHGAKTQVERELLEAVYAYERTLLAKHGKRVAASYTWRLIDEHGIVPAIERVVTKDKETVGYVALVTMGMQDLADIHGQFKFNFRHAAIDRDASNMSLARAFAREYEVNGPSLFRLSRNMLTGWRRYRNDVDPRVRARLRNEARQLRFGHAPALWAMARFLRDSNRRISEQIGDVLAQIEHDLGGGAHAMARVAGPILLWSARREARVAPAGRTLEPRTFVDRRHWGGRRERGPYRLRRAGG